MRKGWMKKYQKNLTKLLREANRSLEKDNWYQGRFYVMQRDADFYRFEDGSGGILHAGLRVHDKKTGYYHDYRFEYAPYYAGNRWHLYMDVLNKFLVEDYGYYHGKESVEDYTKISYISNDNRMNNYFMPYNIWKEKQGDGCKQSDCT